MKSKILLALIIFLILGLFFTYSPFDGVYGRFRVQVTSIGTYEVTSSVYVDFNSLWDKTDSGVTIENLDSVKEIHKKGIAKTKKEIHKMQRQTGSVSDYIFSLSLKDLFVE